jgi:hypothetical protein
MKTENRRKIYSLSSHDSHPLPSLPHHFFPHPKKRKKEKEKKRDKNPMPSIF